MAGLNVTFMIFLLLAVLGTAGGALAAGEYEDAYKIALFVFGGLGTAGSFLGVRRFHLRRKAATGDPRTTLYSALTIYSMLFFAIVFLSLALVLVGRTVGWIDETAANFVAYFFVTDVVLLLFLLGCACVYDMRRPGLLARRVYLWPWEALLANFEEPNDASATRNDADRNEVDYDEETHGEGE